MSKIKVAIDAGHGTNTPGKRTAPFTKDVDINGDGKIDVKKGEQFREHYANVGVANLLYNKLKAKGFELVKTGWNDADASDDPDDSLTSRQQKIRSANCDYSISIHFNASSGDGTKFDNGRGVEIIIHNTQAADSKALADFVLKELIKGSQQLNRGVKTQGLSMCNCQTMGTKASILVELAFMTNEYEAQELMANSKFWEESAEEITQGLLNYLKSKNIEIEQPTPTPVKTVVKTPVVAPAPQNTPAAVTYHIVKAGDTLFAIANRYKTTVAEIQRLNGLRTTVISVNQKLLITDDWVARLQRELKVNPDNVAGPITLAATPTLQRGSSGEIVRLVQERLISKYNISITGGPDGRFGPNTTDAVKKFQKDIVKSRTQDGIITKGAATWKALLEM